MNFKYSDFIIKCEEITKSALYNTNGEIKTEYCNPGNRWWPENGMCNTNCKYKPFCMFVKEKYGSGTFRFPGKHLTESEFNKFKLMALIEGIINEYS